MIVEVVDIFSMVTFQIFNILLKGRCSANTMSAFSLLLTRSKSGYAEIPLAAAYFNLKLVAGDTTVIQLRDTATASLTAFQMFLHLLSINSGCLCALFLFRLKCSLQKLWFHWPFWSCFFPLGLGFPRPALFYFYLETISEAPTAHLALNIEM